MNRKTTPTTDAISQISLSGNIIDHNWYKVITIKKSHKTLEKPRGYPHLLAINLLGDIIYWYRNTITRDERTGNVSEIKKKFAGDKLQRSYQQISEFFGSSWKQSKEAVDLLVERGLITREFRTVNTEMGKFPNIMYLEPIPENILALSVLEEGGGGQSTTTMVSIKDDGGGCLPIGKDTLAQLGDTNTESTTETTSKESEVYKYTSLKKTDFKESEDSESLKKKEIPETQVATLERKRPSPNPNAAAPLPLPQQFQELSQLFVDTKLNVKVPMLTETRKSKLNARLKSWSLDEIIKALRGYLTNKFYRGENDTGWKVHIDWLLRNDETIEKGLEMHSQRQVTKTSNSGSSIPYATEEWMAKEFKI